MVVGGSAAEPGRRGWPGEVAAFSKASFGTELVPLSRFCGPGVDAGAAAGAVGRWAGPTSAGTGCLRSTVGRAGGGEATGGCGGRGVDPRLESGPGHIVSVASFSSRAVLVSEGRWLSM